MSMFVRTDERLDVTKRSLSGMVVAVTGSAGAIGSAVVEGLLACDATVAALDVTAPAPADSAAHSFRLDVTQPQSVVDTMADISNRLGRIDALVNCAGVLHADSVLDVHLATWRHVFAVNVEGTLLTTQAVVRHMRNQELVEGRRGLVINVGSRAALMGRPHSPAYGASKAAVQHMTASFRAALTGESIGFVIVHPGDVLEGMLGAALPQLARLAERPVDDLVEQRPVQSRDQAADLIIGAVSLTGMRVDGSLIHADGSISRFRDGV